jgi:hypothetical protein
LYQRVRLSAADRTVEALRLRTEAASYEQQADDAPGAAEAERLRRLAGDLNADAERVKRTLIGSQRAAVDGFAALQARAATLRRQTAQCAALQTRVRTERDAALDALDAARQEQELAFLLQIRRPRSR